MKRKSRGRGIIHGRRCPKIQNCPTCGRMRVHHPEGYYVCPVPKDVTEAIDRFRKANGTRWKSILCDHWQRACADLDEPDRQLLQWARNAIGPRRLYNLRFGD
jgi:hypothetical protein